MNDWKRLLALAAVAGVFTVGCAGQRRIEGTEIPTQPQTNDVNAAMEQAPPPPAPVEQAPPPVAEQPTPEPTTAPPPPPEPEPCSKYIVVKGDTLWDISAKNLAYQDNFQWPLIFKANRDQIKDPDLIYPKQEFCIRHDFSKEEMDKARQDAIETPKYVPHTQPREVLPIDYF